MWHHHLTRNFAIITVAVSVAVLLPGCRRQSEQPPGGTPVEPSPTEIPLQTIDLPQSNPEIGVTLDRAPSGLAATYNGEYWIELADVSKPALRYTIVAAVPNMPAISPITRPDFEEMIRQYGDGKVGAGGGIETRFGAADWASGTYSEDGEQILDVRVFVPHPSGSGVFVVYSRSPAGLASLEERLAVIQELVANVG